MKDPKAVESPPRRASIRRGTFRLPGFRAVWATLALLGLAVSLVVGSMRRRRRRWAEVDPLGPRGCRLPEGEDRIVVTDDGARLAVTVAGRPDQPTVVLAHCWTGSRAIWGAVARRLVQAGHRVVLYDQRGHGSSTMGSGIDSVERLGSDLATVVAALDVDDFTLVGHSMGGMTVMAGLGGHPTLASRTRSVVLASTAARIIGLGVGRRVVALALGDGMGEFLRRRRIPELIGRVALGRRAHRYHAQVTGDHFIGTSGAARSQSAAAMVAMDLRPALGSIAVPVTILVGGWDLLTPPFFSRRMARRIPRAQLEVLPELGHMLPLEAPDAILDAIVRADVRRDVGITQDEERRSG